MSYDIFISYRRSDRELVANVVRKLEAEGASVWYDANIEGGADWREVIVEALTNSNMLVIFFSEECNQSRQLKKELAVADSLELPVVPILIEDTKPKGAYLYELADRNWLQAYPDPVSKIEDIVKHLIVLAAKGPGGLEGAARAPGAAAPRAAAPATEAAPASVASMSFESAAGAEREHSAPAAIEMTDAFAGAPASAAPPAPALPVEPSPRRKLAPSVSAQDYIKRKDANYLKREALNDILPFRWIDLFFLVPMIGLWAWLLESSGLDSGNSALAWQIVVHVILALLPIGLYGALVFPFRYYLRRRRVLHALSRYILSSLLLYGVLVGAFFLLEGLGKLPDDNPWELAGFFGVFWAVFTVIAFAIYAVLTAQRAMRQFRRNLKKI